MVGHGSNYPRLANYKQQRQWLVMNSLEEHILLATTTFMLICVFLGLVDLFILGSRSFEGI